MIIQNTKVQVVSLVLIFTLSFVFFANQRYFSTEAKINEQSASRFPASVDSSTMASTSLTRKDLTKKEENDLAADLAKVDPRRNLASVGEAASEIETLRFGKLEGKYSFTMDGDHVAEIALSEEANGVQPTAVTIADRADFLKEFSSQFGVTNAPKRVSAISKGDTLVETYRMKSVAGNSDRLIHVTIGQANSLLQIRSEVAPENHIF